MDAPDTELGPIDYLVVELPDGGASLGGSAVAELAALARAGTIRLLDVVILRKATDGSVEAIEVGDVDGFGLIEEEFPGLLGDDDIAHLAWALEPGTVAGVAVWENRWTTPFLSTLRGAGARPIAGGRIHVGAIAAAVEAAASDADGVPRQSRGLGRGVMGSPVARTAETDETEVIAARGLARERGRRATFAELA